MSVFAVVMAAYQWYEQILNMSPAPRLWTFAAAIIVGYSVVKIKRVKKDIKNRRLGRDGELVVGQHLEALREKGYHVFHDLIDDGFNLDHIIIGPAGAFTVETKTWSKPEKGQAIIDFDGDTILINGNAPERNPIVQAKAQKEWLQKLIFKTSGKKVSVRAVVVYPGWFIRTKKKENEVWVLEPKALSKYLKNEKQVFSIKDVDEISFQISRYIRESEGKRKTKS